MKENQTFCWSWSQPTTRIKKMHSGWRLVDSSLPLRGRAWLHIRFSPSLGWCQNIWLTLPDNPKLPVSVNACSSMCLVEGHLRAYLHTFKNVRHFNWDLDQDGSTTLLCNPLHHLSSNKQRKTREYFLCLVAMISSYKVLYFPFIYTNTGHAHTQTGVTIPTTQHETKVSLSLSLN